MRYLGNKTALLSEIASSAAQIGFQSGTVCDLFAGSGVVSRSFRERGSRVLANDLMRSSFVFQRVFLELAAPPAFDLLRQNVDLPTRIDVDRIRDATFPASAWEPALRVITHLEAVTVTVQGGAAAGLADQDALLTRQYSPAGRAGRRYFTEENAQRIDRVLAEVRAWRGRGWLAGPEEAFLIAAVLNGADRVANISGTYGAYLKRWQVNAKSSFRLVLPPLAGGPLGAAHNEDAFAWLAGVEADLLYLDPPYNHRQYPANYHLMEIIARMPSEPDLAAFEASIYGKTGLIPWQEKKSRLCSGRGTECADAFRELLRCTQIPRVVISYNEEGIIERAEFDDILAEYAGVANIAGHLREVPYRRFRSDTDRNRPGDGSKREYKQLPGRKKDEVCEWLFAVKKNGVRA